MMFKYLPVVFLWFGYSGILAQSLAPDIASLAERYPAFYEEAITSKRFGIDDLIPLFDQLDLSPDLHFSVKARSLKDRPVYLVRYGEGEIPVLFWSQMHGDESTATMALLDLFNYFSSDDQADQEFLELIREKLTLYFIPMLNPDGASTFHRRNAAHIDLNRDALYLANPESKLLKGIRDSVQPVFGFNLHDQSIYYRAGRDGQQVALAFLAPAFDYAKNINGVRMKSMQLITVLSDSLQTLIPGRIAKYDDSFEPRAFGDNIQKWGTSTILIESGGYPDDPEKQFLRKLNFITLVKALESIVSESYTTKTIEEYKAIPPNDRKMMSLIIRDVVVPVEGQQISMDVGYQYEERVKNGKTLYPASINDVGDLSVYSGLEEWDAEGGRAIPGKWYPQTFKTWSALAGSGVEQKIREGYLGFIVEEIQERNQSPYLHLAPKRASNRDDPLRLKIAPGNNPHFFIRKKEKKWVVYNGKVYSQEEFIKKAVNY